MTSEARFESVDAIIAFAIKREEEAVQGYARMAEAAEIPGLKTLLLELKGEEENHKKILEGVSDEEIRKMTSAFVQDLKISDFLAEEPLASDMTFQDLLIFAAQKEKKAVALYERLAGMAAAEEQKKVFEFLAGQERAHKLKLETEYDKHFYEEN